MKLDANEIRGGNGMRKIDTNAAKALVEGRQFSKDNTVVTDGKLYLHKKCIAMLVCGKVYISVRNKPTNATLTRLNAVLMYDFSAVTLRRRKGEVLWSAEGRTKDNHLVPDTWYIVNTLDVKKCPSDASINA